MIKGKTFDNCEVFAKDDGGLYSKLYSDGRLRGCTITVGPHTSGASSQNINISAGHFIACGRVTAIVGTESIPVPISASTGVHCMLVYEIDTDKVNTDEFRQGTFKVLTRSGGFPVPVQQDINGSGSIYQLPIARYMTAYSTGIYEFTEMLEDSTLSGDGIGGSNPNLLDNAFFSIAQHGGWFVRGGTTYYSDEECTEVAGTTANRGYVFRGRDLYDNNDQDYYIGWIGETRFFVKKEDVHEGFLGITKGLMDRWLYNTLTYNNVEICHDKGARKLVITRSGSGHSTGIYQILTPETVRRIKGKNVTLSVKKDGIVYSAVKAIPADPTTLTTWDPVITIDGFGFDVFYSAGDLRFEFYSDQEFDEFEIEAVKLELGTKSTLAQDQEPSTALELVRCQRYLVSLYNTIVRFSKDAITGGWYVATTIQLPTEMEVHGISSDSQNPIMFMYNKDRKIGKTLDSGGAEFDTTGITGSGTKNSIMIGTSVSSLADKTARLIRPVCFTKYSIPCNVVI